MSLLASGQEISQWRKEAIAEAIASGISPSEVDWLLQEVAGIDSLSIRIGLKTSAIEIKKPLAVLNQLWQRRLAENLPVQYLAGVAHWRHFSLKVTPDVLIPRPETEYLIDLALEAVKASREPQLANGHWVDLGTGSGAIALGLAAVLPEATVHGVDCSPAALAIATENAQRCGLAQIQFYCGSWWSPLESFRDHISGMVSNPPYIPTQLIPQLQPEVANHEPHLALDGGSDGLDSIRYLIDSAPQYLRQGGIWLIEMMAGQGEAVASLLHQHGSYEKIQIFPDLAGIERYALAYRR